MSLTLVKPKPRTGPSHLVVTSWSPEGHEIYGKKWLETFTKHWPDIAGAFVVQDAEINAMPEAQAFFGRHTARRMAIGPKYNYRDDLVRFAHKIFALKAGFAKAVEIEAEWLIWLDGDVHTVKDIGGDALKGWTPEAADIVLLSRVQTWDHPECGFMAFNLKSAKARIFLTNFIALWESDEVLKFKETHDSHVFGEMLRRSPDLKLLDLCPKSDGLEAFAPSPLGPYLVHEKGFAKFSQAKDRPTPSWANRYALLNDIVKHYKPKSIIEVGTWAGDRALELAKAAHDAGAETVHYRGFDLFETATPETDSRELNVKRHATFGEVNSKLSMFATANPWFSFTLTPGDTRITLNQPLTADFVFIDGGHSIETIRNDYAALKENPVVVLDDWYLPANGKPDVTKFGVNAAVVDALPMHPPDPVSGGGQVCLAIKLKVNPPPFLRPPNSGTGSQEEIAKLTGGAFSGNMILKTRNCRPEEELRENIKANWPRIKNWLPVMDAHGGRLILVSGGKSLETPEIAKAIKAHYRAGDRIACVKHSHNDLIKMGVIPWACVLLDPRPHEGPSTHGYERKTMLAKTHTGVKYFTASMVDPTVLTNLLAQKADVWGWNAAVGAEEHTVLPKKMPLVMGGSTAVMRGVSLGHFLGFRNIICYGMDSCHLDPSKLDHSKRNPDGSPHYFTIEAKVNGKAEKFWTDRDLMAQTQDVTRLLHENPWLDIDIRGPGICAYVHKNTRPGGDKADFAKVFGEQPNERPSWWRRLMAT